MRQKEGIEENGWNTYYRKGGWNIESNGYEVLWIRFDWIFVKKLLEELRVERRSKKSWNGRR